MKKNTLLLGLILTSLAGVVSAGTNVGFFYENNPTDTSVYYIDNGEQKKPFIFGGYHGVEAYTNTTEVTKVVISDPSTSVADVLGGGYNSTVGGTSLKIEAGKISDIVAGGGRAWGNTEFYDSVTGNKTEIPNANVLGDINIEMTGGIVDTYLVGGNYASKDSVVAGNIDIRVTGGEITEGIRGGSYGVSAEQTVKKDVTVFVGGNAVIVGKDDNAFEAAGSYGVIEGDLKLTIADNATIKSDIYGGGGRTDAVHLGVAKNSVNNVQINIQGGNIQANVYGGALKYSSVESTSINISGGVIEKNVYAGGGEADKHNTIVNQTANINISGGTIKGNVYASGTSGTDKIIGTSTVTLTNNAKVEGTIHGRTLGSTEDGDKVLNFGAVENEQNVAFNGKVNVANFDTINVKGNSNAEIGVYQALKGGTTIDIASGSTLTLNLAGNVFSSTSLENAGSLVLNKGSYTGETVTFKAYNGVGTVYGGWFDGSTLNFGTKTETESSAISATSPVTVKKAETLVIADNSAKGETGKAEEAMKVNQVSISASSNENANVKVNNAEVVDFTVDTFNNTGMDEVAMENILTVWTFDIDGVSEENGVVLSFVVGEGFDVNTSKIWHRSDATGNWEDVSDSVSGLTYDGNTLSFIATEFSDYSLTTTNVPEPAEWAAIFGTIALGFVMYRRRK